MADTDLPPLTPAELKLAAKKFRLTANCARRVLRREQRMGGNSGDRVSCDVAALWDRIANRALTRAHLLDLGGGGADGSRPPYNPCPIAAPPR